MLTIWLSDSPPSVPSAAETTQRALIQPKHWCLPINPRKCEASFFQWILMKLIFSPTSYSTPLSTAIPRQLILRSSLAVLSFSAHASLLKIKFFPRLKTIYCISAFSLGPLQRAPASSVKSFSPAHSNLCFTRRGSICKRY